MFSEIFPISENLMVVKLFFPRQRYQLILKQGYKYIAPLEQ